MKTFAVSIILALATVASISAADFKTYTVPNPKAPPLHNSNGLEVPRGFRATLVAKDLGTCRHIAVRDNGDIYITLFKPENKHGLIALRDTNGDGKHDWYKRFGGHIGTGTAIYNGYLYTASDTHVYRYKLGDDLAPDGPRETIVADLPSRRQHAAKTIAFDDQGYLYVNIGAPSNSGQERDRTPGSPGLQPSPILKNFGGIWRFRADTPDQKPSDGTHYATGIRHAVAIDWNPISRSLYIVMHGRDQLNTLWPELYNDQDNAQLPSEDFYRLPKGANCGWPYTYYDPRRNERMIAPEYGGDGKTPAPKGKYNDPLVAFPAHWAPNDLLFYTGKSFPARYHGGAFVAFHGSWNRAPLPQAGYKVVFVPFDEKGMPTRSWEVFADGFAGSPEIRSPGKARYRPCGLAQGPDGSLYICTTNGGAVWKISPIKAD